jgi:hypothetical protein
MEALSGFPDDDLRKITPEAIGAQARFFRAPQTIAAKILFQKWLGLFKNSSNRKAPLT